jgi:CheY-like chemotaxis protein
MAAKFLKDKQTEIIDIVNQLTEFNEVDSIIIETFSGSDAAKNAIKNIQDSFKQVDLVITDLNMDENYSGCDVIQEVVKRDPQLPVYVVSNSLSEYFKKDENNKSSNTCETLQSSTNNVVNIYKNCCVLPNILGVSESKTGKLQIGEIEFLFQKFIEYKRKIIKTNETNSFTEKENGDVLTQKSSLLTKFRNIIATRKSTPTPRKSTPPPLKSTPTPLKSTPLKSTLLTKIKSIIATRKTTPQKSSILKKFGSIRRTRKITPQNSSPSKKTSTTPHSSSLLKKNGNITLTRKITPPSNKIGITPTSKINPRHALTKIIPSAGGRKKIYPTKYL